MAFMVLCSVTVEVKAEEKTHLSEDFNLLVQQYLLSNDPQQSAAFLKDVLAHPKLTLSKLEDAIKTGRVYPAKPSTGSLHKSIEVAGYEMSYAMHVPKNYDAKKSYPLIICLHGAGFVGDSYIDRWQSRLGSDVILVCPTIQGGAWWSAQGENLVLDVMDAVSFEYNVNPEKVYLTGMSNGGIGVYLVGMFHADRFAAISPRWYSR